VFAYNDDYAMMLIRALQDAGLSVPDDIAVMGVDDLPACEMIHLRLTSVSYDWAAMADVVSSAVTTGLRNEPLPECSLASACAVVPRASA
jgi:DNA-binding LacI/PurR family transcriptional regulator